MMPILFRIPGTDIPIYAYGLMMVIGFFLGMRLMMSLAKRYGINPDHFANAALIALLTGVIGARLSHVLENLGEYTDPSRSVAANLWDALNIRSGGLTYYGGFLLAFPALVIYAIVKKIPLRLGMDIVAPALMIGLAFGRLGCLLNGCCYGATCDLPWAMTYPFGSIPYVDQYRAGQLTPSPELIDLDTNPDRPRLRSAAEVERTPRLATIARHEHSLPLHPAQAYSAITAFLIAGLCLAYMTMPHAAGQVFALMLIVEGATRFLLELLRAEPAVGSIGSFALSFSMYIGPALTVLGLILWLSFRKRDTLATPDDGAILRPT
jgi:phosphatidylglycerol---prolipoprotein diacylglyceryl transferase